MVVDEKAVPELVRLLSHDDDDLCDNATLALARICEKGHAEVVVKNEEAVPELVRLLSHDVVRVRKSASNALCEICKSVVDVDDVISRAQFGDVLVNIGSAEANAVLVAYEENLKRRTAQLQGEHNLLRTQPVTPMQVDGAQANKVSDNPFNPRTASRGERMCQAALEQMVEKMKIPANSTYG